jgi:uncharacterized protein YlzI (FlbEa/FlbD family)
MNLVMLNEEGCREVYVAPETVESVQTAAGGKESIVYLKSGRKLIVSGRSAEVMCKLKGIHSWRDALK